MFTMMNEARLSVGMQGFAQAEVAYQNALAYAQRAVIDVAQNRNEDALANGAKAVDLAPDSSAARIAHSYALQATFQLGAARQGLEAAVAANPDDALAHARLAY